MPNIWNSTTNSDFAAGDSVFIQVKAIPTTKDSVKSAALTLSIKTLAADSSSSVKFVTSSVKNADGSMEASLGVKLK